jgi:signal transduction histidine kinase
MLLKSNADLAELHAEKNRILGIAAHDLRNPVGATSAYADLILENLDSLSEEETIKYLNI